jgi:hypothetical protein
MDLVGALLSLVVSLTQEIAIVIGVGALTVTLVGHLLSLHAEKNETVFAYVRAARSIRAIALMAIIVSGGAALLVHFQTGTLGVLLAPAFLFKWLIIALLTAFHFAELQAQGYARDAVEGFEGANWYALLIVHTMAPVMGWLLMFSIYLGWLATFAVIWAGFVWLMRHHSTIAPAKPGRAPNPFPAPGPVPMTASKLSAATPIQPSPVSSPAPTPAQAIHVMPKGDPILPVAPKSAPVLQKPAPVPVSKIEIHPNHTLLPMIAELDLPAPGKVEAPVPKAAQVAPAPAVVAQAAVPAPVPVPSSKPAAAVAEVPKPKVQMTNLDESGLAALHVMPKRLEDIETSKRGPVIKMVDE